jgi:hypothetical protein
VCVGHSHTLIATDRTEGVTCVGEQRKEGKHHSLQVRSLELSTHMTVTCYHMTLYIPLTQ